MVTCGSLLRLVVFGLAAAAAEGVAAAAAAPAAGVAATAAVRWLPPPPAAAVTACSDGGIYCSVDGWSHSAGSLLLLLVPITSLLIQLEYLRMQMSAIDVTAECSSSGTMRPLLLLLLLKAAEDALASITQRSIGTIAGRPNTLAARVLPLGCTRARLV